MGDSGWRNQEPTCVLVPEIDPLSSVYRNCTQITDAGLTGLGPQMEYLDLSDCSITDKTLFRIASSCPALKLLKLSSCHISDPYVERLCIACPHLSTLSFNSCDLISGCPRLLAYLFVRSDADQFFFLPPQMLLYIQSLSTVNLSNL